MPQQLGALATLRVWATDDGVVSLQQSGRAPRLTLTWSKYRGPGAVTFADQKPSISHDDLAVTTASFSAQANTCCGYWRTITRVLGVADHSAAGQMVTRESLFACGFFDEVL